MNKTHENEKKKLTKKQKIIVILLTAFLLIATSIFLIINLRKKENENKPEYKLVEVTSTISKLEDGTYYMFGAKTDQAFEIKKEDGYSYQVVDEENKKIETEESAKNNVITIKPKTAYEEGKTYSLKINKAKFVSEELKESNQITFSIVRKSTQSSKLKSDVIVVKEKLDIIDNNDIITLKTNNSYKENDILLVGENENQKAYKVGICENNECTLTIPELKEVYDEFDFYGSAILDMSEIEHNKEIEEYLAYNIEKSVLDKVIPTVNATAKTKVEAKYDKKEKAYIATIHVETDPNDKIFNKSFLKYHRLSFDYEAKIKFKINYDINLFGNSDINLVVEIQNTPSIGLEHAEESLDKIKDGLKAYTANANVAKMLKGDYDKIETDSKRLEQEIGKMIFPTPVTGLNLVVDIGLIMDFDIKANMNATLTNINTATIGYSTKKGLYGSLKYTNNIDANMFGSAEVRLGSDVSFGADLLGIMNVNGSLAGGIYGKGEVDIKTIINKEEITTNLNAKTKAGLFSTISGEAKAGKFKASKVFFDGTVDLYNYELPLTASSKLKEDKPVVKPEEDKPQTLDKPQDNPVTQKDKYYTVTLYYYASCYNNPPYNLSSNVKKYKVKKGTTLKNSEVYKSITMRGEPSAMYYHNFLNRAKKYNELESKFETCYNACAANYPEGSYIWETCHVPCKEKYDSSNYHGLINDYNIGKPINENISIVTYGGCGGY